MYVLEYRRGNSHHVVAAAATEGTLMTWAREHNPGPYRPFVLRPDGSWVSKHDVCDWVIYEVEEIAGETWREDLEQCQNDLIQCQDDLFDAENRESWMRNRLLRMRVSADDRVTTLTGQLYDVCQENERLAREVVSERAVASPLLERLVKDS